jgi:hypothetical protein
MERSVKTIPNEISQVSTAEALLVYSERSEQVKRPGNGVSQGNV